MAQVDKAAAGVPATQIERFALDLDVASLHAARQELLDRVTPDSAASFRWGYLLGVEPPPPQLTAVRRTIGAIDAAIGKVMSERTGRHYERSFLKTAIGPPPDVAEGVHHAGFHLDTHPELTSDRGVELARVLVNLAQAPRRLRYAAVDRFALGDRVLSVPRSDYQVVDLPRDIKRHVIEIPPFTNGIAHGLCFWASVVPHVGVDDEDGHFLASYEALAPYDAGQP